MLPEVREGAIAGNGNETSRHCALCGGGCQPRGTETSGMPVESRSVIPCGPVLSPARQLCRGGERGNSGSYRSATEWALVDVLLDMEALLFNVRSAYPTPRLYRSSMNSGHAGIKWVSRGDPKGLQGRPPHSKPVQQPYPMRDH